MDLNSSVSQIIKALKALPDLVGSVANSCSTQQQLDAFLRIREYKTFRHEYHSFMLHNQDITSRKRLTYADLCNNIFLMIFIRQDIVMRLEYALRQSDPSREMVNRACDDIDRSLDILQALIRAFYAIVLSGKVNAVLPNDIHKMMAETDFAIEEIKTALAFDDVTQEYHTTIFSNEGERNQIQQFCNEMKRMVTALCDMKLDVPAPLATPVKNAEVVTLKPGMWGVNVDLKELWRRWRRR